MGFGDDLFDVFDDVAVQSTSVPVPVTAKRAAPQPVEEPSSPQDVPAKKARIDKGDFSSSSGTLMSKGTPFSIDVPISVHSAASLHSACTHQCSFPPGWAVNTEPLTYPTKPAREYKFELDAFQRESVMSLERGESVLVSAHTSAGKTVIAEYAISMSLRDHQRVIYTSPIKALSNQKYREFYDEFSDVGLMTGDVTINPSASCLVMTTEILRSMLYRGSEILREVKWVIFDEIHYMRDKERGVVWEETIILLPDTVRMVFLSATIPNAREFAEWFATLHNQPCHAVYTDYRPTPLQHYIFPAGGDGLHLVVDEHGNFRDENFQKALSSLAVLEENKKASGGKGGRHKQQKGGQSDIAKIVKMIMDRNYDPVIVFAFSKREVEALAIQMSKLDFNDDKEKELVDSVFNNAMDSLSQEDRSLPQIESILPLLRRGIGIHHSGLLPILKEVIEILFQEGLLKALFATETFSMGINMPAKTVVFTSVRKFDGDTFRWISGGEYIQMSGRAGRRGLDDRGIVIMMIDEKMEPDVAKGMVKGQADPLNSTFHLSYAMVLNMYRMDGVDPKYMIERSFVQFQHDRSKPRFQDKMTDLEKERDSIQIEDEGRVSECYSIRQELHRIRRALAQTTSLPMYALPFLQPGRLVQVTDGDTEWGWGVVVNFSKKVDKSVVAVDGENNIKYIVDVLLNCATGTGGDKVKPKPCPADDRGEMQVVPVVLSLLSGISSVRVYIPKDLRPADKRLSVHKTLKEVQKRFPDGIPLLDPIEDMLIQEEDFKKQARRAAKLEETLLKREFDKIPNLTSKLALYHRKVALQHEAEAIRREIDTCGQLMMRDELKAMKRILRNLDYLTAADVVTIKGRVACEISTGHELVMTELMFEGVFGALDPKQICALLSAVICQEKVNEPPKLREELASCLRQLHDTARRVAKVAKEFRLPNIDPDEFVQQFRPDMMEVVYAWSSGSKFSDICRMTTTFEGSIIRCIRRLEELLEQMVAAAKCIGNTELEDKFNQAIALIKRDIVFAASLYL
eukprot:TRINITY_DN19045_c0_g1::TRINITY_DN19045_c0_g1_i1::g.13825::m.13825 TRINITY_DN19045_c0_g1::TRINITY_DN19045_c0_g1_i1::g.13825  ORF type:complete len:1043 (-),score=298.02,sp/P42285/SK2L2_HUMAN/58.93/0.0,rRNA_proc-arch/PF13234.1/2.4e-84,DSHCT/PF08148.7/1e-61,DEAD/PF00270.24/1.3e-20,DEAD/PF00270.24/2e+03,Helicase_C/PF00271.26/4.9e-07,MutS_III/PF05192.13/5.7,MutS_III/PF05192.13/2.3,DUF615/PF04751.9/0.12,Prp19/PF08606.6/12,Prp19/PF08606.6/40,DBC1/PF14443.1/0.25 TRINITY_DN19045_c0_g1_i1:103-3180(-)